MGNKRQLTLFVAACTVVLLTITVPMRSQDINTIVGGGNPSGPAKSAYVAGPTDVVEDSNGNIFISGIDVEYVFKLDTTGNVTTYAGTGYGGFEGVGGPATKATISGPTGLAVNAHNNLFIADDLDNHIWEVNAKTGILTNVAGSATFANPVGGYGGDGGKATKALLNGPQGVAVDPNGNIFIADTNNNVVRLVKPNGIISTYAGMQSTSCGDPTSKCGDGGPATQANLNYPIGVVVDAAGNLYIADAYDNRVRRVSKKGIITTVAGNGKTCQSTGLCGDGDPATKANLNFPAKAFVDKSGNLYIADENNEKIRFVNATTHIISTLAGDGNYGYYGDGGPATEAWLDDPTGLFVDASGNILIADQGSNRLREVTGGNIEWVAGGGSGGDGGQATQSVFAFSYDMVLDSAGNQFIIDFDTSRIREVDAKTQVITTVAGNGTAGYSGDGGPATSAALDYPRGLAVDGADDIFIADAANWVVRVVQNGTISTYAGNGYGCFPPTGSCGDGGPATQANLNYPEGVVVDAAGNLYIADTRDQKIRKVDNTSQHIITTVAGNGNVCPLGTDKCGDGGAATMAKFNTPTGIAIDSSGNLFIADSMDNRIRRVDAITNKITTVAFDGQPTFGGDGGPPLKASMQAPNKVVVDAAGDLFVAGGFDNVIRKVDFTTQKVSTVAGDASDPLACGFKGDGGPATKAVLCNRGIFVTGAGDLYIPDNNRVRYVPHAAKE